PVRSRAPLLAEVLRWVRFVPAQTEQPVIPRVLSRSLFRVAEVVTLQKSECARANGTTRKLDPYSPTSASSGVEGKNGRIRASYVNAPTSPPIKGPAIGTHHV